MGGFIGELMVRKIIDATMTMIRERGESWRRKGLKLNIVRAFY